MKTFRRTHHFRLWMAFLVVVAAFLFQMRQGSWGTLLNIDTPTTIYSSHSYKAESPLNLDQQNTLLNSTNHSHHQNLHIDHDAHCLFCITQAFSGNLVPFVKLGGVFYASQNYQTNHVVSPLFIASNSHARAPPQ